MDTWMRKACLVAVIVVVLAGCSCHGGENARVDGSAGPRGAGNMPVPPATGGSPAVERSRGVRVRDNVLSFLMIKEQPPEVLEEQRRQRAVVDINDARFRADRSQPPVDASGNIVEGWDMSTVKMGPRNIMRYLKGLPPVK